MTPDQRRAKERFIARRGFWHASLDPLLWLNPRLFERYVDYSALSLRTSLLSPKEREFIYIAIDCNANHLYEPGLRLHLQNAIRIGASALELGQVMQLVGLIGVHSLLEGLPALLEEAGKEWDAASQPLDPEQSAKKAAYMERMGNWPDGFELMLRLDAECFDVISDLDEIVRNAGPISPKVQSLIRLAADIAATSMYLPGARQRIREALHHGATPEEIAEVFQLVSVVGLHSCTFGAPILIEEIERAAGQGPAA